jgi:hypothetical protein
LRRTLLTISALTAMTLAAAVPPAAAEPQTAVARQGPVAEVPCVPNSTPLGPNWSCRARYFGSSWCTLAYLAAVEWGMHAYCAPRYDGGGFDLWIQD